MELANRDSYSRSRDKSGWTGPRCSYGAIQNSRDSFCRRPNAYRHHPGAYSLYFRQNINVTFEDYCLFDHFRRKVLDATSRDDRRTPSSSGRTQRPPSSAAEEEDDCRSTSA